ncbi:alpha/beta fold hydrolase [Paraburkholderia tuberum]|uniref:Pimeloyl-ACP methyl ester carboxylesterase n=1 Tax=Paraburkholderia tuberum TaxID=157910 RepID=A0A1H1KGL7_9BURK|nr:alpha/beta hydrolase [Paraburkholderia tuberum]SDR61120.1 Pimeloyl-ACP methyl ester carboxylesterase [Paraburkholderia tuberum]
MDIVRHGDGPRHIVAVHGIQGTRAVWRPLAESMEHEVSLMLPNLRGRGVAMRGTYAADYSLEAFAGELALAIDACTHGQPYCLAGWSMGVTVSLASLPLLAHRPERLILMSGSPSLRALRWFHAPGGAALEAEIAARKARLGLVEAADHNAVAWTWQAIRDTDQRASLASIDIPTLILHGAVDDESPIEHAHWLLEGLPTARLEIIADAGHSIPTSHTAEVAASLRRFLST